MNLDQIMNWVAFVGVAAGIAIPLIQKLITMTHSEKIKQVETWALQAVKWADDNFGNLAGKDRKAKAIDELGRVLNSASQKFNINVQDIERYISDAYLNYSKQSGGQIEMKGGAK